MDKFVKELSGLYLTDYGIYRASEGSDGKLLVEKFKGNEFVSVESATMDIFMMGMRISEKDLKSIVALADGDDSVCLEKWKGGLCLISKAVGMTMEIAKQRIS